jgi:Fic family protein
MENVARMSRNSYFCRENWFMANPSTSDITGILAQHLGGISLPELHTALGTDVSVRTLQRQLADLSKQGLVRITGRGRGTRYLQAITRTPLPDNQQAIPISLGGKQLLAFVEQPLDRRPKAGYQASFLRNYGSITREYLSTAEGSHLMTLGQTVRQQEAAGTYARHILQRLLIDLSWNSSRLEGNSYSLLDTQQLLKEGQVTDEKSAAETQMILNHKEAIEFLVDAAADIQFNRYTLLNLHALLSNNLLPDPAASGRLRTFALGITNSTYLPPGIPQQIEEYFDLFLAKAQVIQDPFEQAFFAMVHIPYLQPFDDVNKRVSRLAANIPLNRFNLAPLSFVDVPRDIYIQGLLSVYERTDVTLLKDVFLYAYERSAARYSEVRQTLGDPDPFRLRYRDAIRQVVSEVVNQTLPPAKAKVHLTNYARQIPGADRDTFINVVETELLALHEGNFARYRVLPPQFAAWQVAWKGK